MQWNGGGIFENMHSNLLFFGGLDPVFGELYHRLYVFLPPGGPFLSFFESAFRSLQYYFFPRVLWKYILYLKKKKLTIEKFPFKNDDIFGSLFGPSFSPSFTSSLTASPPSNILCHGICKKLPNAPRYSILPFLKYM